MLPFLPQILARPRWLYGLFADGGLMSFPNVMLPDGPMKYAEVGAALEAAGVCWADFKWIRDAWDGPIVVKGAPCRLESRSNSTYRSRPSGDRRVHGSR